MAGRIVLFGATGFTGRLVAAALVERGARPVLAARSIEPLRALGDELGGLEVAVADVARPESVRDLVERGDVLISTVGPFMRFGDAAVEAAVASGAHYLDSTGEPPFIRRVFDHFGPRADGAGVALLTALGYDYVPGNLAAALALRDAGEAAVRVRVGYYFIGRATPSGGTQASTAASALDPHFAYRDGRIQTERAAKRYTTFEVEGESRPAVSVGSTEHFGLPAAFPRLREVDVYLGWFGRQSRGMQAFSAVGSVVARVPGATAGFGALTGRLVKGSTGGPEPERRSQERSYAVAVASDASGRDLAEARVAGVNGYDFTGGMLAWAATRIAESGVNGRGALGPVEAFGLDELEAGVREAGIERVS
ncbi:MAG TPA: saccharopine dehydrogenase NADP-binding domain-containing protein [Thermoleophilaceae bacterium]